MQEATRVVGELMTAPPPVVEEAEAADLARSLYGLEGRLMRLTSERDANFRLVAPDGQGYVVKFANPVEPVEVTNFQTEALRHIARVAPDLPVPRVVAARDGRVEVPVRTGILRVLTYLEGTPMHMVERSADLRRTMGDGLARIARALRDFDHPAAGRELIWDIRHTARLRALLPSVQDEAVRVLAELVIDTFEAEVAPALPGLHWQVVHSDLNPHNVLVDPADHGRMTGVLDFGDMVRTPRICDLAVAASYQIAAADPLGSLAEFVAAYHAVYPLERAEIDLLFDLIAARMVTTICITSWRASVYPDNAPYILRNFPLAKAGLDAFAALSRAAARRAFAAACGLE